jgi:D-beta-D-heptose 7-phosphate kinase/D-beta-D-heptose 1-phosphate adenosyltransferase
MTQSAAFLKAADRSNAGNKKTFMQEALAKIHILDTLCEALDIQRRQGKQVVFTNGCFDLMHAGHVRYLCQARSHGDILVVGLNSDYSVRTIKGQKRPIVAESQRAEVLAGLACVDYVVLFDEPDPLSLIQAIGPDVLVKGADWTEAAIVGADIIRRRGGRVVRIPFVHEIATTEIINRIMKRYCHHD